MIRKLKNAVKNNKGSVLLESLCAFAILTMVITFFSLTVISAQTLFRKAAVRSNQWETAFNGVVEKNFPPDTSDSSVVFNAVFTMKDMDRADIILSDGTPFGAGSIDISAISGGSSPAVIMLRDKIFRRYGNDIYIYAIVDN